MKKSRRLILAFLVLASLVVILGPVAVRQISPDPLRRYEGVSLDELQYREVTFRNEEQNLDLSGMLFVPEGGGPHPGVIIIHGSGTSQRENRWYLTLVGHLQGSGVVVLLPDKRGSEGSEGNWRTSSLEDLATDTLAAVQYLKEQDAVPVSPVGVIGMSQGGWIAPIVAVNSSEVSFVVNVVGTSVTAYEQLAYEENNNLRELGFLPGISNLLSRASTFMLRRFGQRDFWEAVGNFDPLPYWRKIDVPTLVLYGSEDLNVPTSASRARFEALGKENIRVKIYAGSGHALEDPAGRGNRVFREEALMDMTEFINSVRVNSR